MTIEKQVCSLELAKKMKELGFEQESFFQWEEKLGEWNLIWQDYHKDTHLFDTADLRQYCSAFTSTELGGMLPERIEYKGTIYFFTMWKRQSGQFGIKYYPKEGIGRIPPTIGTMPFAMAKMLIYLKENELIIR